jgi:ATP-binding cassette subfamily C protein
LGMMLISSALELLGIGLIMPVIAILADPNLLHQNKYLKLVYDFVQPSSQNSFLVFLCIALIILYLGKNTFLAFQNYAQNRFILNKGAKLANTLFSNYIHAPYKYHLTHNAGRLLGKIGMADTLSNGVLVPLMILFTEGLVILFVFATLLFLSPVVTIVLAAATLLIAALIYFPFKNLNLELGDIHQRENIEMNKYALQGLKAIKESKVRNREDYFTAEYAGHRFIMNQSTAKMNTLGNLPRFIIEALIVSLGMGALLLLIAMAKPLGSIILTLSLFAVSAIRLMPSMTRIQYNLARIKQQTHGFNALFDDLADFELENKAVSKEEQCFESTIELKNIHFAYSDNDTPIFNDFSLVISKNSSVGLVGSTGCGKTTLIDIVLGLLKPQKGAVLVDGVNIDENLVAWQKKIGYVPQFIFLLDDSIKANVAFGFPDREIDEKRVVECLKMAQIQDFVSGLTGGIDHIVGENGIQLSGGQRQRIGIARALYNNPEILVLDEATSALDNETEKAFIDALDNLQGKLTIIMIAHRLTTVENCDKIVRF